MRKPLFACAKKGADQQGIYEPRSEKTGLRGVRPGPTQTGLYRHTRWLEARNFVFTNRVVKTKALISFADTNREADLRLCFRICKKPVFS